MHPFLDTKKLSDEEIIERLGKAYQHLNYQTAMGHTPTIQSIKEVITSLEDERKNRLQKTIDDEIARKYPNPNKSIDLGKLEE
jgi:hypothetical protein